MPIRSFKEDLEHARRDPKPRREPKIPVLSTQRVISVATKDNLSGDLEKYRRRQKPVTDPQT